MSHFTDVEFEIVDDGTGAPEHVAARSLGAPGLGAPGIPRPALEMLARLAGGLLRGHEADALGTAAILGGYVRDPARFRAVIERGEPQINAFLQEIDLAAVIETALAPSDYIAPGDVVRASVPALAAGALAGFFLSKLAAGDSE